MIKTDEQLVESSYEYLFSIPAIVCSPHSTCPDYNPVISHLLVKLAKTAPNKLHISQSLMNLNPHGLS